MGTTHPAVFSGDRNFDVSQAEVHSDPTRGLSPPRPSEPQEPTSDLGPQDVALESTPDLDPAAHVGLRIAPPSPTASPPWGSPPPERVVQRKSSGSAGSDRFRSRGGSSFLATVGGELTGTAGDVQAIAAAGLAGSGGRLPHLDRIQQSFGHHDVSAVQAHTDGAASAACDALDAGGFASGDHVALADTSLHTAAHEAAHTLQQRSGVQLEGGVGTSGDAYEQHADAVADAVVAGRSAASLLDAMPTAAAGSTAPAVQLQENPDGPPKLDREQEIRAARRAHEAEIRQIIGYLKGKTYDEDLHNVLRICSHWDSATITAVWQSRELSGEWYEDVVDNLSVPHFRQHPREVLAFCQALGESARVEIACKAADDCGEDGALLALWMLQGVGPAGLDTFRKYDGGDAYEDMNEEKKVLAWARPLLASFGDAALERQLRTEELKRRGEAVAEQQASQLASAEEHYNAIKRRLKGVTYDEDAREVLRIFRQILAEAGDAGLGAMVRRLEPEGWMKDWVENIPEDFAYSRANVGLFMQVLSHRPPETAIQHAIKLISYGLFDWAVTDAEALLAYHLIRALPPSAQQEFRSRDKNKWFSRLEGNLEASVIKGQKGDTEGGYGLLDGRRSDPAGPAKKRADEKDALLVETQKEPFEAVKTALEAVKDAKSALAALDMLYGTDQGKDICGAFARTLEAQGLIEPMLSWLGDQAFTGDAAPKAAAVLTAISPDQDIVARQKEERKRDTEIVTAEESRLDALARAIDDTDAAGAPALLKSLADQPDDVVRAFTRYLDRRDLVVELLDKLSTARWDKGNATFTLRVLAFRDPVRNILYAREMLSKTFGPGGIEARMAYDVIKALPADVRKEFATFEPEWLKTLDASVSVELRESKDFGFYRGDKSGDQTALLVKLLDAKLWAPENFGHLRLVILMLAQAGPDALRKAQPRITEHWGALKAADEDEQAAAKRAADEKTTRTAPPPRERLKFFGSLGFSDKGFDPAQVTDKTWGKSYIGQGLDLLGKTESGGAGLLGYVLGFRDSADVKGLRTDELQDVFGGHVAGIRFGKSENKEKQADKQDTGELDFKVDEERGLLRLDAEKLPIEALSILSGTTVVKSGAGTLEKVHIYLKYATDVDPETRIDLALGSLVISDLRVVSEDRQFGAGSLLAKEFAIHGRRDDAPKVDAGNNWIVDAAKWTARFLEYLPLTIPALIGRGYARDFGVLVENIKKALADETNAHVQLGSLVVDDVVDSRGGHIGKIEVANIDLDLILNLESWLKHADAEIAALEGKRRDDRTGVEENRLQVLRARTKYFRDRKAQRDAIAAELQAGKLGEDDRKKREAELEDLDTELKALNVRGGIARLDFGKDIDFAGLKASDLNVSDIRIEGSIAGGQEVVSAAIGGSASLRADASLAGKGKGPTVDARNSGLKVTAGKITGHDVSYTSQTRRDIQLQTAVAPLAAKETAGTITEAERAQLSGLRKELDEVKEVVKELAGLEDQFATLGDAQRRRYELLVEYLKQAPSIKIAALELTDAGLGADLSRGEVFVHAGGGTLTGVQVGDTYIQEVTGKDLRIGGTAGGGGRVSLDAKEVVLAGLEKQGRYARVLAQLAELAAKKQAGTFTTADAAAEQRLTGLKAIHDALESEVKADKPTLDTLQPTIAELRARRDKLPADAAEGRATLDKEIEPLLRRAQPMLRRLAEYEAWHGAAEAKKVTVADAHLDVNNVGDFLAQGFTPRVNNLELSGRGDKDGALVGSVLVEGAKAGLDTEPDKRSSIERLELKNLKGKVKLVDENHVELDGFGLDDLSVDKLDLYSGDSRYQVLQNATLKGLTLTAQISWANRTDEAGGVHRELDNFTVSKGHLDRIEGTGIDLLLGNKTLKLKQGALVGIDVTGFDLKAKQFKTLDVQSAGLTDLRYAAGEDVTANIGSLGATGLHARQIEGSNKVALNLEDLDATGVEYEDKVKKMGLSIRTLTDARVKDLTYDPDTGDIDLGEIFIKDVLVPGAHWHGEDGASLEIGKGGKLFASTITARARVLAGKEKGNLLIDHLNIVRADVENVTYRDPKEGRVIKIASGGLDNILLTGFDQKAKKLDLKLGSSAVRFAAGTQIQEGLAAEGEIKLTSLEIEKAGSNKLSAKLRGFSTEDLKLKFKDDKDVSIENVVDLGGTKDGNLDVRVEGGTTYLDNIDFGTIGIRSLDWTSGEMHVKSELPTTLTKLTARAKIVKGADKSLTVEVERFHIVLVDVEHLLFTKGDLTIALNKDKTYDAAPGAAQVANTVLADVDMQNVTWIKGQGIVGNDETDETKQSKISVKSTSVKAVRAAIKDGLSLDASATAGVMSVKFQTGGKLVANVADLNAKFSGQTGPDAKPTKFGGEIKDFSTGDITVTSSSIEAPSLSLKSFVVDTLDVPGGSVGVKILPGGAITMGSSEAPIKADVVVDRASGKITVKSLEVPASTAAGVELTLPSLDNATLTVPKGNTATLGTITLTGLELTPPADAAKSWSVDKGTAVVASVGVDKLKADFGASFNGTTKVDAGAFTLDFVGEGKSKFRLADVTLSDIQGKAAGAGLVVGKAKFTEINKDAHGNFSVGDLTINDVTYSSELMTLVIKTATLPADEVTKLPALWAIADDQSPLTIPLLKITDASFDIPDVMKIASPAKDTKKPASGSPDLLSPVLDKLHGDLKLKLTIWERKRKEVMQTEEEYGDPVEYYEEDSSTEVNFDVKVRDGTIDLDQLQDGLSRIWLGSVPVPGFVATKAIWWTWDDTNKRLVFKIKLTDKLYFSAASDDKAAEERNSRLGRKGKVRVANAIKNSALAPSEADPDVLKTWVELTDIGAEMYVPGRTELKLADNGGTIILGSYNPSDLVKKNGLNKLIVTGKVLQEGQGQLQLGIAELNAALENLRIAGKYIHTTGDITVKNVHDVTVDFNGFTPTKCAGKIESATAQGIEIWGAARKNMYANKSFIPLTPAQRSK